jgi:hypothetical protein
MLFRCHTLVTGTKANDTGPRDGRFPTRPFCQGGRVTPLSLERKCIRRAAHQTLDHAEADWAFRCAHLSLTSPSGRARMPEGLGRQPKF